MAKGFVYNQETGERQYIDLDTFDASRHELEEGQSYAADPFANVEGVDTAVSQRLTTDALTNNFLYDQLSPERQAQISQALTEEELYGGTGEAVSQFLLGGASGLTFGLSDLALASDDPWEREAQRRARGYNQSYYTAGQIIGGVAPGLISGGTGTAATIARLTPAGRLSALTGRIAGTGGYGRAIAGGAVEGLAGAVGDHVARQSLEDNPTMSASALASVALGGAILGGGAGAAGELLAKGAGKLSRRLERVEPELAEAVVIEPARRLRVLDDTVKPTSFKRVVKKELAENSAESARQLGLRIDDVATRTVMREVDDFLNNPAVRQAADVDGRIKDLASELTSVGKTLQEASQNTSKAFRRYSREVDLDSAVNKVTKEAAPETEDLLAAAVAESDTLSRRFDTLAEELSARVGVEFRPIQNIDSAATQLNNDVMAAAGKDSRVKGALSGVREKVEVGLGAAELAQQAGIDPGIPSLRQAGPIGELASLYVRYKGLKAAGRRVGVDVEKFLPGSKTTQAAEKSTGFAEKWRNTLRQSLSKGFGRVAASKSTRLAPAQVVSRLADINSITQNDLAQAAVDMQGLPDSVIAGTMSQLTRAASYLQEVAPKDPLPVRPSYLRPWEPTESEAAEYGRRLQSVIDPSHAAAVILGKALNRPELETMKRVYPDLYRGLGEHVLANSKTIAKNDGLDTLRRLGSQLSVPVTIDSAVPWYGTTQAPSTLKPADPLFTRPSTPGASPSVNLESTAPSSRPKI